MDLCLTAGKCQSWADNYRESVQDSWTVTLYLAQPLPPADQRILLAKDLSLNLTAALKVPPERVAVDKDSLAASRERLGATMVWVRLLPPVANSTECNADVSAQGLGEGLQGLLEDRQKADELALVSDLLQKEHVESQGMGVASAILLGFGAAFFVLLAVCLHLRRTQAEHCSWSQLSSLPQALYTGMDLTTDVCAVVEWTQSPVIPRSLCVAGGAFVGLPIAANLVYALLVLRRELGRERFLEWWKRHASPATGILLLSSTNAETMRILGSKLLNKSLFSAPFSEWAEERLEYGGVISKVLEDLPQMYLQWRVLSLTTAEGGALAFNLNTLSLFTSAASLLFGITKRGLTFLANSSRCMISGFACLHCSCTFV